MTRPHTLFRGSVALGLAATLLSASPALAGAYFVTSPDLHAKGHDNADHDRIYITDTAPEGCDGDYVYMNWHGTTDNRFENHSGCGSTALRDVTFSLTIRACHNKVLQPDSCSGWKP
jgi:hypothetical protein